MSKIDVILQLLGAATIIMFVGPIKLRAWVREEWLWVAFMAQTVAMVDDGALLVADDVGNIIWRVAPDTRAN